MFYKMFIFSSKSMHTDWAIAQKQLKKQLSEVVSFALLMFLKKTRQREINSVFSKSYIENGRIRGQRHLSGERNVA